MSFLCSRIPQKVYWFAIILWFTSLNRIFIWPSNDSKLGYILPIPYYVLVKKRELRETGPERCCLTLSKYDDDLSLISTFITLNEYKIS